MDYDYEKILYNEIGKNIQKARKKLGITQEQLADMTHFSDSLISNIESKTYQSFSISTLYIIAKALNTTMRHLLPDENLLTYLNNSIKCEFCSYETEIPSEIVKLLFSIEEITHHKVKLTCPKCNKKIMF